MRGTKTIKWLQRVQNDELIVLNSFLALQILKISELNQMTLPIVPTIGHHEYQQNQLTGN